MLSRVLTRSGYTVDSAENGASALAHFEVGRYALVLSDICMPEMSGVDLFHRIKALNPAQLIVLMTGFASGAVRSRLPRETLILTKPFSPVQLLDQLAKLLPADVQETT